MDSIHRVSPASGVVRNRITGFERTGMLTEARLLRPQLSPLVGISSTLSVFDRIGRDVLRTPRLMDGILGTSRLMNGVFGRLDGYASGWPDLSMLDRSDRAAWSSVYMNALHRSTRSGPYALPPSSATTWYSNVALTLYQALSRAGPAPPGFWTSAVGVAQRAAAHELFLFGRALPRLCLQLLVGAYKRIVKPYWDLWRSHALLSRPQPWVLRLRVPLKGAAPSLLVRSQPSKAHAPPCSHAGGDRTISACA